MNGKTLLTFATLLISSLWLPVANSTDCIILLHGLARTSSSMEQLAQAFKNHQYNVVNTDYPSRKYPIEILSPLAIETSINQCIENEKIHFVTHSLGGILVRYYLEKNTLNNLGRVVMLAPPNKGSEVVDTYKNTPGFSSINGPAGLQLGTDKDSIPSKLGPVTFELGVIAGTRTINPILSLSLPNPDDGKVSLQKTKVEGMSDFLIVPVSHPFIMNNKKVIQQTMTFIETGKFDHNQIMTPKK